jgi:hypothetical protein
LQFRRSYGCDCSGPAGLGRVEPQLTDGQLDAVEKWTGLRPRSCPWRVFADPFVARVQDAHEMSKRGMFAQAYPDASYRLIEGVAFFGRMLDQVDAQKRREDEINRANNGS